MGQHYYKVPYNLKRMAIYLVVAMALWGVSLLYETEPVWVKLLLNTGLLVIFLLVVLKLDLRLSAIPYIGKFFKSGR